MLKIKNHIPSSKEYNFLGNAVGWGTYEEKCIKSSLKRSIFSVAVFDDRNVIAMGRIVGDLRLVYIIQDVIVLPEYQGKGLGRGIMDRIWIM